MTTILTPEISKRKPYYISKHRYYELKHFCLQYPEWEKKVMESSIYRGSSIVNAIGGQVEFKDPVHDYAGFIDIFKKQMEIIETCAVTADPYISNYILSAVCYGKTFEELRNLHGMPCGRGYFYKAYRKFFWYLDKLRS